MKTKEQQKREAEERRRRYEKEQFQIKRDIVAGRRHPNGIWKTGAELWEEQHKDDPR